MNKFNFKIRAVQLDLARQMETVDFIRGFIDFIVMNGYNTLVFYLEGRIKTSSFPYPLDNESYTSGQMRDIVQYAGAKGVEIIPVIPALGHAELLLKYPDLEKLAETRGEFKGRFGSNYKHVFCPSLSETYQFLEVYFSEICEIFPSLYFHAGCDESWDIGCCDLCRERLRNGESQADIFAKHLLAVRRIVTGKLHKRMIVWDDMFELYPLALEALPRDVVMACWQYQADMEKTRGHFNNGAVADTLAHYDQLGFDYLICPADYSSRNVESFTSYGAKHRPLGGLMTIWEKSDSFMQQSMPAIAYAGRLWESGGSTDCDQLLRGVISSIFGIDDEQLFQAIKAVCTNGLYLERRTNLNAFLTKRENIADFGRAGLANVLVSVLPGYLDKVKASSRDILEEIIISLSSEKINHELNDIIPEFFKIDAERPELNGKLQAVIARIEDIGKSRVAMWGRIRHGITPCKMETIYEDYLKSMREIPALAAKHGYLKVHFMLPDQYSAQTVRIFIKYDGELDWNKIGEGVFKGCTTVDCFYNRLFMIDKDKVPDALKIETMRFGGQGFTYFEVENECGRFVPAAVRNVTGNVSDPENMLSHDWRWSFAGDRNTLKSCLNPELAETVHVFEIKLRKYVWNGNPAGDRLSFSGKRMAFLGDSITDGHTLAILFEESLKASGITVPVCTNVAVAGNRASDMLARLDRDVIPLHADYVTLSAGVNDANTGVPPEQYAKNVTDIVDKLTADGSQVIILTPTPITSPKAAEVKLRWTEYNTFLRNLASQRKLHLSEFDRRMEEAIADGQTVMGGDGVHIDFPGYRVMTRALLDTLGYVNVPVVEKMTLALMPGVISTWKVRQAPSDIPLTESDAANIKPDADWKALSLPQEQSAAEPGGWWLEQERKRGFAIGLDFIVGKANRYQCVAEIANAAECQAYLNTGGSLDTIWLNGKKIFKNPGNSGWHAGKERIQVTLKSGTNQIIIETGPSFFLSLTDDNRW